VASPAAASTPSPRPPPISGEGERGIEFVLEVKILSGPLHRDRGRVRAGVDAAEVLAERRKMPPPII